MIITSAQNNGIKRLRGFYRDKKLRQSNGVFIAEGVNLVKDIPENFEIKELYIKESKKDVLTFLCRKFSIEPYIVKDSIFDSVSDTVTPSGVIAVVGKRNVQNFVNGEIVLVLDGISDSGNLGTIIRTAAARGIKSVICADCTDAYSPKAVRAAMGGTFRTEIIETTIENAVKLLSDYKIVGLDMSGISIYGYKKDGKIALVVGSEAHGISDTIRNVTDCFVSVPMANGVESLNAAVCAGIAMYLI